MAVTAELPTCPSCGFGMVRRTRRADGQAFWGCPRYPTCRGTRPIDDVLELVVAPTATLVKRDRPGASADRQFERRRDKHKARVEADRPAIIARGVVIVVIGVVVSVAAPPAWQPLGWAAIAIGVMGTLGRLFVLPQHVVAWETGGEGERATASRLEPLRAQGFMIFHDRQIPMSVANVDHIVVGPTGVWVIETKSFGGRVRVQDGELRVNGRRRKGVREEVEREVLAVGRVVAPVPVQALVVVHRADFPLFGEQRLAEVPVIPAGDLAKRLTRGDRVLTPEQVAGLAHRIDDALAPALGG